MHDEIKTVTSKQSKISTLLISPQIKRKD